jgi:uncharacterized RDD family membrane protein YckC
VSDVVTGDAVVLEVPLARFPSRMMALLLDLVIQIAGLIMVLIIIFASGAHLNEASSAAVILVAIVLAVVGYPVIMETLTRGRSVGKLAFGLRVVSDDGGPERFRQALVRGLAAVIEIYAFTGAPALICALLNSQGKRLGDLFAGTFVIQERLPDRPLLPAQFATVPWPLTGWAQQLEISRLSDQTADAASSYLRRFHELVPAARDELGARLAAAVVSQVSPPPPPGTPPAALLATVLAVRRQREAARLAAQRPSGPAAQTWPGPLPAGPVTPGSVPPGSPPPGYAPPGHAPPGSAPPESPPGPFPPPS